MRRVLVARGKTDLVVLRAATGAAPVGAGWAEPATLPTDLAPGAAGARGLLAERDALAILLRATAVVAFLLARLFLFLLGVDSGHAEPSGERGHGSAHQGAARVSQAAQEVIER